MVWRSLLNKMSVTIPAKIKNGVMENQANTWPTLSPSGYSMCNIRNGVHLIESDSFSGIAGVGEAVSGKDAILKIK